MKHDVLHRPQRGHYLFAALQVDTDRGVLTHLVAAIQHLAEARLPAAWRDVRQEPELTVVDTEHGHVARGSRRADNGAITTQHHLHIGALRLLGVGFARAQPVAHALGQCRGVCLARVGDYAQPLRTRNEDASLALAAGAAVSGGGHVFDCAVLGSR